MADENAPPSDQQRTPAADEDSPSSDPVTPVADPQAPAADPQGPPAEGRFDSATGFAECIRTLMTQAAADGARRIEWCDADYLEWPIGEPAFIDTLTRWARAGGRELVMVGVDFDAVRRRHPRFAQWRSDWAHAISCLLPDEGLRDELPTLWLDTSARVLRVFDRERWRGRMGADRLDRQRAREAFDALSQRAVPSFSSTTLGL